jgi:all-trans-retinol 13,14-reductase
MDKSVVIIGGGIGGLVSACLLSKEGYKVTVLEKHNRIGGGLHCFDKYGTVFESGIHYVSGFQEGGALYKLFKYLGILDKIHIMPLDNNGFDVLHIGDDNRKYVFGVGKENFINILSKDFPDEKENIANYLDAIYDICNSIPLYNLKPINSRIGYFKEEFLVPVGQFIESFIQNEKLKDVLVWNNCLYAGNKNFTPIYIHALVTKFYIEGASRFVGGSQHLADAMVELIEQNGGDVYLSAKVNNIVVENKKVTKIVTDNGLVFTADYYISSIHPAVMLDMIDPNQIQRAYRERLQNLENTYSAFIVFVDLKPDSFPFLNYNYYYYKDYKQVWDSINYEDENSYPPGFMLTTPPSVNQSKYADRLIVSCVMKYDDVKQWENTSVGHRDAAYYLFKQKIENKMLDLVEQAFPSFRQSINHVFSSTPLTIRDYFGSKNGSLYGYKKDCTDIVKTQIMPRTKIENLLLTGQNLSLHGIIGVPLSAIVTVGELVGFDNLITKINEE